MKLWLLRLHRWITLTLAIPLAALILTGLVLSFEPIVQGATSDPDRITLDAVKAALTKHDAAGTARSLMIRTYDGTVSIGGAQRGKFIHVDLGRNEAVTSPGLLAQVFTTSRRLHETFLLELGWLVTASTVALLVLIAIGVAMGWPRLRNNLSGWHKGSGWFLLPLLVLSPLTGLFLAFGLSFSAPLSGVAAGSPPVPLREAVDLVSAKQDLSRVAWIRPMANRMMARVDDGGELRVFAVTREGLVAAPRNWPRLLHEGNWGGIPSALINVLISVGFVTLLSTGLLIWARRTFRRRRPRVGSA